MSSWSEVVHEHRIKAELQRAREEHRLRRRGYDVEEKPSAGIPAVLALAGVLTAAAWWRKEGRKAASKRDWRTLPGISHLLDFLQSGNQPKRGPTTRSKSKPKAQLAPPSKAAAARQAAAAKAGRSGSGGGGSSSGASAAAAAGAAAMARASGGGSGVGGGNHSAAERQAGSPSTSYSSSSNQQQPPSQQQQQQQQSQAKKKKKNKKKK